MEAAPRKAGRQLPPWQPLEVVQLGAASLLYLTSGQSISSSEKKKEKKKRKQKTGKGKKEGKDGRNEARKQKQEQRGAQREGDKDELPKTN